jgi:hypothetical protein
MEEVDETFDDEEGPGEEIQQSKEDDEIPAVYHKISVVPRLYMTARYVYQRIEYASQDSPGSLTGFLG